MIQLVRCYVAAGLCVLAACEGNGSSASGDAAPEAGLDAGALEPPALCDREGDDAIRDLFCVAEPPDARSLAELQRLLELTPSGQRADGHARFVMLGHSTALSGHLVSPINPRVILIGDQVIAAFQRGVQRVELISQDRRSRRLNFYLLSFEQACNGTARGCAPGDLYTPQIERDWLAVQLKDDTELQNTPADCRPCHQRGLEEPRLLMRELESPWTHFLFPPEFMRDLPGVNGSDLTADYIEAKGDERYAGASMTELNPTTVFELEQLVGRPQPLLFDAPAIENERYAYGPQGYDPEPRASPTWEAGYEAFKRGEQLAQPYLESRVSDVRKQAVLSAAYQRFVAGELAAADLPDLSDIFPDDPKARARIGLQTEADASPAEALIQACGSCHNDVLDQSVSRARFNIDVARLERAEIELAIERIERDPSSSGAMPPAEARALEASARARLLAYLRDETRRAQPDPMLERAARLGMAGGAGPTM